MFKKIKEYLRRKKDINIICITYSHRRIIFNKSGNVNTGHAKKKNDKLKGI